MSLTVMMEIGLVSSQLGSYDSPRRIRHGIQIALKSDARLPARSTNGV